MGKTLLKRWHEETAKLADTEGLKINAADTSRVIKTSFKALAEMVETRDATELEIVQLLIAELRKCR